MKSATFFIIECIMLINFLLFHTKICYIELDIHSQLPCFETVLSSILFDNIDMKLIVCSSTQYSFCLTFRREMLRYHISLTEKKFMLKVLHSLMYRIFNKCKWWNTQINISLLYKFYMFLYIVNYCETIPEIFHLFWLWSKLWSWIML